MFWAETSTTAPAGAPLGWALPLGEAEPVPADALAPGAADADGAAEADVPADALGSAEGIGVALGAGAYVQPGVDVAHAATAMMLKPAASRRIDRMGGVDLEMFAGDRGRDVPDESTASGVPSKREEP
jgi:hypothetical protein